MKVAAIIVAAGQGKRMGEKMPKQYLMLGGKPVLYYTLRRFLEMNLCKEIVLVVRKQDYKYCQKNIIEKYHLPSIRLVEGGKERQDSVSQGLAHIVPCDYVIVHDGVRCLITSNVIDRTLAAAKKYGAAIAAVPVKDTIKQDNGRGFAQKTVSRSGLWLVQTPQIFRYELLQQAYLQANQDKFYGTDDAMLVERMGIPVKIAQGEEENIKITTPLDLQVAEMILARRKKR